MTATTNKMRMSSVLRVGYPERLIVEHGSPLVLTQWLRIDIAVINGPVDEFTLLWVGIKICGLDILFRRNKKKEKKVSETGTTNQKNTSENEAASRAALENVSEESQR